MAGDESTEELIERLLAEIRAREFRIAEVRETFDPMKASPEQLRLLGFPARPDGDHEPARLRLWESMFAPPQEGPALRFAQNVTFWPPFLTPPPQRFTHGDPLPVGGSRHQRSLNWSGASIASRRGRRFTEVHGLWQVPAVTPPPGASPGEYRSSTWIGIDGQRRYLASSLPQIGTAQFVRQDQYGPQAPEYSAWFQWWMRDQTFPPLPIHNFALKPGDLVRCAIYIEPPVGAGNPIRANLHIRNESTGQQVPPILAYAPILSLGPVDVTGETAEWVMERPAEYPTDRLFFMPKFATVVFGDCRAVLKETLGPSIGQVVDLAGARLMDLTEVRPGPRTSARKITATRLVGSALVLTDRTRVSVAYR